MYIIPIAFEPAAAPPTIPAREVVALEYVGADPSPRRGKYAPIIQPDKRRKFVNLSV